MLNGSRIIVLEFPHFARIIIASRREFAAKMKKSKKNSRTLKKDSPRRGRGRPQRIDPLEVVNRADDYRAVWTGMWDKVWPLLSVAETKQDVFNAINSAEPYQREQFLSSAQVILALRKDPRFPKRKRTRINFLADSLAARGVVTPRRSRDICSRERRKQERTHRILRVEFYIECSCGYRGPSQDFKCPKCDAPIPYPGLEEISQALSILQFEKHPNEVNEY